jgi:CxxC motif-containing protein (DUF1111 family)
LKASTLVFSFCVLSGLLLKGPETFSEEALPGGERATVKDVTENSFGHPFPSLSRSENREFFVGNSFFKQAWVQAPSSTAGRDGLGPTFNAVSCSSCHLRDGRGRGGREDGFELSILYRLSDNALYGNQLNPFGIGSVPGEGRPEVLYRSFSGQYADGEVYSLRAPVLKIRDWAYGKPEDGLRISARVAPQLIGLGLLERIPEDEIIAGADPSDKNGDGISGEVNWVIDVKTSISMLGRFGWKAEQPSVRQQTAAAFNGDMGLTSPLFPDQNCPTPQADCQAAPSGGLPGETEVSEKVLDRVTLYSQTLAVPHRRNLESPDVLEGQRIFSRIGCAQCHRPNWKIETDWEIYPYTDMLLHDMGPDLSDLSLAGEHLATTWRTPPLWGLGLIPAVNGHSELLHDGRARSVEEAILWHGGEALSAQKKFVQLGKSERNSLVEFIKSL